MKLSNQEIEFLKKLKLAGISFHASIPTMGGHHDTFLEPEGISEFIEDKFEWIAKKNGVAREDYIGWLNAGGAPQCGKILKNGNRCKNLVSGPIQRSLNEWLQEDAGLCTVHGGEPSSNKYK